MPRQLNSGDAAFEAQFAALLNAREDDASSVADVVRDIIASVRREGDAALIRYTQQFDRVTLSPDTLRISAPRVQQAVNECAPEVIEALALAAERLRDYHARQMPADTIYVDGGGTQLGWRWRAVDAVGLYVPGGKASYPSSVLHNAIAAQAAGVNRLAMVVPTPDDAINPAVLAAAHLCGIDEIYAIGGAQAVAALAFGTQTIAPVDMIVGPGNAYVAEAKRQVFGHVGIDAVAGPSEILVVADSANNPDWIAADLLSQAEHDAAAQSILITDDADYADAVAAAIENTLKSLPREAIARASWENHGAMIVVSDLLTDAPRLIDALAPEHLELAIENPQKLAEHVRHAGAIFLGRYTPEAIGDYLAGPSHVLPTSRTARFSSGLSVQSFLKRTSLIGCSAESFAYIGNQAATLADAEGLQAHALSLRLRSAQ